MGFGPGCGRGPFGRGTVPRQRLPGLTKVRSGNQMDDGGLSAALDRAERAIERVQRALAGRQRATSGRDDELRAKVREVVEDLDELIREAAV